MSTHWRAVGMSYLQYVNKSANVMRQCLKEPMKTNSLKVNNIHIRERLYQNGVKQEPGKLNR